MNINRDNYEMYFMMYVDNELSAAERNAVKEFINGNKDLQKEMDLLQAATLQAEDITFVPKTLLYKNATSVEGVQESLLLHLDNELSPADAAMVNAQIGSVPAIAAEWDILQRTKLAKDHIVFKDKSSLYRHTDNVISIRLRRIAVAAVLLGVGLFVGVSVYTNKEVGVAVVSSGPNKNKPENVQPNQNLPVQAKENIAATDVDPVKVDPDAATPQVISVNDKPVDIAITKNPNRNDKPVLININKKESNQTASEIVKNKEGDQLISPNVESHKQNKAVQEDIAVVEPPAKIIEVTRPVMDTEIIEVRESFAKLASNNETGSNDRILYMDEDKLTRSKLGGFFRKVKRVVERNTKIKTSNGLRIGGFEFAVK